MKKRQDFLTDDQAARLAPYERFYRMTLRSDVCSYPGEKALRTMCEIWEEMTGERYPFKRGCNNCIINLVRDMGTLYVQWQQAQAKAAAEAEAKAAAEAEEKAKAEAKPAPKKKNTKKKTTSKKN